MVELRGVWDLGLLGVEVVAVKNLEDLWDDVEFVFLIPFCRPFSSICVIVYMKPTLIYSFNIWHLG